MGRTADFDRDDIILKAMNLFWKKGYFGTSLSDLVAVTGLKKGSLYNTFESKENLFFLCLEKYEEHSLLKFYRSGDPLSYLKSFFSRLVDEGVQESYTQGCLIMNSCLEFAPLYEKGRKDNANNMGKFQVRSQKLFDRLLENFENVTDKAMAHLNEQSRKDLALTLISSAFTIREMSKFRKDRSFLMLIANNALRPFKIEI